MTMTAHRRPRGGMALLALLAALLAGCGGYDGKPRHDAGPGGDPGTPDTEAPGTGGDDDDVAGAAFFARSVQPHLGLCRVCHVPGGMADRDGGRLFMLAADSSQDAANLRASWTRLGGGADSRILRMASGEETPHSAGAPWPRGSVAHTAVARLLACYADASACGGLPGGGDDDGEPPVAPQPLLGSSRGGWPLLDFCQGDGTPRPDDTPLPTDPRALVLPETNAGKAVHFNTHWKDCHTDPERVGGRAHVRTCGELRASVARGERLLKGNGAVGAGVLFRGNDPAGTGGDAPIFPASAYNQLWRIWGMSQRPDNFDDLVAQRYGTGFGPGRNPYPLPGEDPDKTDGGSGRLPVWFSQLRDADGRWSGRIGVTCQGCHSGAVGTEADGPGLGMLYGGGSPLHDYTLFLRDMLPLGYQASAAMFLNLNRTRGTSNASAINLAFVFQEQYRLDDSWAGLITAGSTASMDTPAWWNLGHRPLKFIDGIFPGDSARVDLVFYIPLAGLVGDKAAQAWASRHGQDANDWLMSLKAPAWPEARLGAIDTALAEQGAVLFHARDLWADAAANPVPRPAGGNGSCASCHGAYSPRYTHDPAFLDSPALAGMAANITPSDIIGTDPARLDTNNEGVQEAGSRNFFGYPETAGSAQDCGMQNRADLRGERQPGYLAPPLYGVWATAPYFHNGAVPNLWEVLQPADRKPIWRRASTPARADQQGKVVMGYDTRLSAFDRDKVGWKYEALACGSGTGALPFLDCVPGSDGATPPLELLLSQIYGNLSGTWNVLHPPLLTTTQIERRKVYNTHRFSQGNQGHAFTAVLSDRERLAIIEYLKTL